MYHFDPPASVSVLSFQFYICFKIKINHRQQQAVFKLFRKLQSPATVYLHQCRLSELDIQMGFVQMALASATIASATFEMPS